jgi:hypothetical protein
MIWWMCAAFATSGFDPGTPATRFEGDQTYTQDKSVRLWNAVERWTDPDTTLFHKESFNDGTRWRDGSFSPWIATSFGTSTPSSSTFLLHVGIHEPTAEGTPILFVPGAGDNASRGFVTMATREDRLNRPVYALTFAHPHGDVFLQAEAVADAIAVITARTGASQVDVVAHSKGGAAAVTYASHVVGASWSNEAYTSRGTPYRGDIRRLVLIATPLGGIDTAFRWPANNLALLESDTALAPSSWSAYYPYTTSAPAVVTDLSSQDFFPEDGDLFPGQRQLLARQDYDLPGSQSWLGGYALQPDWYTTYEGGFGYYSYSEGIDAAVEAGGDFVASLREKGVDPGIELYLLAGNSPLMPNGDAALQQTWDGVATEEEWSEFLADITDHGVPVVADEDELDGLQRGALILGEVTGASDGLVFVDAATDERALTHRGASIFGTKVANLSHLDLLYASPITGALLIDAADDDPANAWMRGVGARYTQEDTLGWVQSVLADDAVPGDTDLPEDTDTSNDTGDDAGQNDGEPRRPCGGCSPGLLTPTPWLAVAALAVLRRSRNRVDKPESRGY